MENRIVGLGFRMCGRGSGTLRGSTREFCEAEQFCLLLDCKVGLRNLLM